MPQSQVGSHPDGLCSGPSLGELRGGNWMALGPGPWALSAPTPRAHGRAVRRSDLTTTPPRPVSSGGGRPRGLPLGELDGLQDSYLVDSASSHMLVSKIKPCMSKYKQSIQ